MINIRIDLHIEQPLLPVPSEVYASLGAKSLLRVRVFAETLAVFVKHVNGEKHSSFRENSPFGKGFLSKNDVGIDRSFPSCSKANLNFRMRFEFFTYIFPDIPAADSVKTVLSPDITGSTP